MIAEFDCCSMVDKTICHVLQMISVSVHSLCGIAEGCSAQLRCISSIQGCYCGNAAIFAICDITTWPQALSQSKFLRDETFADLRKLQV